VIAVAVIAPNLLYVSGRFDPDPLGTHSGPGAAVSPGALKGVQTIDPNSGLVSRALGQAAVRDWFHLTMPWWNPNEATGAPLAGEMQSAALSPLTILTVFSNGQLFEQMFLELIAGVSTFLLLRRLSGGVVASTAAGSRLRSTARSRGWLTPRSIRLRSSHSCYWALKGRTRRAWKDAAVGASS
jgi:hypothetical protein